MSINSLKASVLLFVAIITASPAVSAQNLTPKKDDKGKWGFVDANGTFAVKPQYMEIEETIGGAYLVAVGGKFKDEVLEGEKWGVIDADGKELIKAEYDEIDNFRNGLVMLTKGGKKGFANEQWQICIEPKYAFVGNPNPQGFVWVNTGGKLDKAGNISGGKYGILDKNGAVIVPVAYKTIGYFADAKGSYSDEKIYQAKTASERAMLEAGSHSLFFPKAIDQKPETTFPEVMGFAFSTKLGLALNGVTDLKGNVLIKDNIYQKCSYPTDDISIIKDKKGAIGFHNVKSGVLTIDRNLRNAFSFKDGFSICTDAKNQWLFYGKDLKPNGDAYNWISPRHGDYYLVRKGNTMSIVSAADFKPVVSEKELIFPVSNGYMAFKDTQTGLWGYLNANGTEAISPRYEEAYSFNHGAAVVKGKGGWGMLDCALAERVPLKYHSITFPVEDGFRHVLVQADENSETPYAYILWETGKKAFKRQFARAWNFGNLYGRYLAYVGTDASDNTYGVINAQGDLVLPMEFKGYVTAQKAIEYLIKSGAQQWLPIHSYRFGIYNDSKRNAYKLKDKIADKHWDY